MVDREKHPTPMLDELESGPWPSFVSGIKELRDNHEGDRVNGVANDLLGQLEHSYETRKGYWKGGTVEERDAADLKFRACILKKTGNEVLAKLMYEGVRAGGSPYFPTWYRWGYGWPKGRGYKALTEEEKALVEKKLAKYNGEQTKELNGTK